MARSPPDGPLETLRWLATTDHGAVRFVREVLSSVAVVLLVGLVLFAASGVWPPMVAVESGSMEPNLHRGDLVFVMDEGRLAPGKAVGDTGVVTVETATVGDGVYRRFGGPGDVIVFAPDGGRDTPVIHRAVLWVEAGENWYDRADPRYVRATRCGQSPDVHLANCPAPHAGFVTKGDANPYYDQVSGISGVVRPAWIRGTAEVRVPWLGYVRLEYSELTAGLVAPVPGAAASAG